MANLTPINPATLGLLTQLANGAWRAWELGTRDGTSPTESHSPGMSQGQRTFLCTWSERGNAAVWFLGDADVNETGNGGPSNNTISRLIPQTYPGNEKVIATTINISGHQSVGQSGNANASLGNASDANITITNSYTMAKLEVGYSLELYRADVTDAQISGGLHEYDRYVSIPETRSSAEYLSMPAGMMGYIGISGYANGTPTVPFNPGRISPWEEVPIVWHRVPDAAWDATSVASYLYQRVYGNATQPGYIGTVNRAEFFGRAAGTMLFQGVRAVKEASPIGDYGGSNGWEYRLEYQFTFNPHGWNRLYYWAREIGNRTAQNGFYLVGTGNAAGAFPFYSAGNVPDNYSLYNERDFAQLFNVGGNLTP